MSRIVPNMSGVTVNGTPFIDLSGRAQTRLIDAELEPQRAADRKNDPGALTDAERARLDEAEQKLAEAQAAFDAAVSVWNSIREERWRASMPRGLFESLRGVVSPPPPSEQALESAYVAKEQAEQELQRVLLWRNRERRAVDNARRARREQVAEFHVPLIEQRAKP